MLPAELLVGRCRKGFFNVCTFRANFHLFLSHLQKTNIRSDPAELMYIDKELWPFLNTSSSVSNAAAASRWKNRVFLYELSQLSDQDPTRSLAFRKDLQSFLGLKQPIPDMIWFKPGIDHEDAEALNDVNSKKIDICQPKYGTYSPIIWKSGVCMAGG